jgi:hypothetical protein
MPSWFGRLSRKRQPARPGGLAAQDHPASQWIKAASSIVRQRFEMRFDGQRISLKTNANAVRDLLGALDLCLSDSPDDPDLLAVRADVHRILGDSSAMQADLAAALRFEPGHTEATLLESYGADWSGALLLPMWTAHERRLHPVIAEKRNAGEFLQPISNCMQPALAFVMLDANDQFGGEVSRCHWRILNVDTPHGPLAAHYTLFEIDGRVTRQEGILSVKVAGLEPGAVPGPMVARFGAMHTFFLIVVDPEGTVLQNVRYELPESTRRDLRKAARVLLGTELTSTAIREAANWHMRHFDLDQLDFPS